MPRTHAVQDVAGTTAPLPPPLRYAPPEVALPYQAGDRTIHVDAAVDIWAIGVIAFELLTSAAVPGVPLRSLPSAAPQLTAAGPGLGDAAAAAAADTLAGRALLPWELGAPGSQQQLKKMRGLKGSVLWCLERDPERRPTAAELCASLGRVREGLRSQEIATVPAAQQGGGW